MSTLSWTLSFRAITSCSVRGRAMCARDVGAAVPVLGRILLTYLPSPVGALDPWSSPTTLISPIPVTSVVGPSRSGRGEG